MVSAMVLIPTAAVAAPGIVAATTTGAVAATVGTTVTASTGSVLVGGAAGAAAGYVAPAVLTFLFTNPIGWAILGQTPDPHPNVGFTWDCWKPIIRCEVPSVSEGICVAELLSHPAVATFEIDNSVDDGTILVVNKWGEMFRILPVRLSNGQLAAHAEQVHL